MLRPEFHEFTEKAKEGNLIPVYREIFADLDTPLSIFLKLKAKESFLLESVEGEEKWARYSFIGSNPSVIIEGKGKTVTIKRNSGKEKVRFLNNPLEVVAEELRKYKPVILPELPRFFGGFVGYIGYDTVRHFEKLPDKRHKGLNLPDIFLMFTDTVLVFDRLSHTIKIIYNVCTDNKSLEEAYQEAHDKTHFIVSRLRSKVSLQKNIEKVQESTFSSIFKEDIKSPLKSNFKKKDFLEAVKKIKNYVTAGDVIQAVISQQFEIKTNAHPINVYRLLRVNNASPYMFYINTRRCTLVGSSPELHVRLEGNNVEVRPIAGTRKRGKTPEKDLRLEQDLKNDPKELAEHIMLVDLGRNDVGRVAITGSVKVTELMTIERYSHVMHIVSNVIGKLEAGNDAFDVLKASFPAGTVTGAPKIRAMEIIEELETTKRGPYAGCVGYFGFSGNMDTCITIRTIVFKNKTAYIQAGAGIVADSDPEKEYMETVNKAKGMLKAVEIAENI
jgi:anthranilate synthase component 1